MTQHAPEAGLLSEPESLTAFIQRKAILSEDHVPALGALMALGFTTGHLEDLIDLLEWEVDRGSHAQKIRTFLEHLRSRYDEAHLRAIAEHYDLINDFRNGILTQDRQQAFADRGVAQESPEPQVGSGEPGPAAANTFISFVPSSYRSSQAALARLRAVGFSPEQLLALEEVLGRETSPEDQPKKIRSFMDAIIVSYSENELRRIAGSHDKERQLHKKLVEVDELHTEILEEFGERIGFDTTFLFHSEFGQVFTQQHIKSLLDVSGESPTEALEALIQRSRDTGHSVDTLIDDLLGRISYTAGNDDRAED
jgi:hypothetical protein